MGVRGGGREGKIEEKKENAGERHISTEVERKREMKKKEENGS